MSRSLKKGWYVDAKLQRKVEVMKQSSNKKPIKTWARSSTITPEMIGLTFEVHNGHQHLPVYATENMVGHKLGEFSFTRKFKAHGGKMAKDQKKAGTSK